MKLIKIVTLIILLCSVLGGILYLYTADENLEYIGITEIKFTNRVLDNGQEILYDREMIKIRVKGAIDFMHECDITNLVEKYINIKPSYTKDKVIELLAKVNIKQKDNNDKNLVWIIETISKNKDEALFTTMFYADSIAEYFTRESKLREDKIVAWFDQEIYHNQRRNKNIDVLKKRKQEVLEKAQLKSMIVKRIKSNVLKLEKKK